MTYTIYQAAHVELQIYLRDTDFNSFFFLAVKFGRMSKKQREKVEDEVRFHRAQMRAQSDAAPDSSVYDTQTPSSSDQLQHNNYNRCSIEKYYQILHISIRYTYLLVYPFLSPALSLSSCSLFLSISVPLFLSLPLSVTQLQRRVLQQRGRLWQSLWLLGLGNAATDHAIRYIGRLCGQHHIRAAQYNDRSRIY